MSSTVRRSLHELVPESDAVDPCVQVEVDALVELDPAGFLPDRKDLFSRIDYLRTNKQRPSFTTQQVRSLGRGRFAQDSTAVKSWARLDPTVHFTRTGKTKRQKAVSISAI